jgi:hypothetical protein
MVGETTNWNELVSRGYVVIRQLLSAAEIALLRNDYEAESAKPAINQNYRLVPATPRIWRAFEARLEEISNRVRVATGINAGLPVDASYFATEIGVNFPWHQDHEGFFLFQQHYHYLNFYIPFIKPDRRRSNLCLVPFDSLRELAPAGYYKVVGGGARSFQPKGEVTRVFEDETGREFTLPINIEQHKATPELDAGDLLLLRGDIIHRTEDAATARVAISFRRTKADARITRARLIAGGPFKQEMMRGNRAVYDVCLDCFDHLGVEEITAQQLITYGAEKHAVPEAPLEI